MLDCSYPQGAPIEPVEDFDSFIIDRDAKPIFRPRCPLETGGVLGQPNSGQG